MNTGHGHVRPRADGVKARCGGPGICDECSMELAQTDGQTSNPEVAIGLLMNKCDFLESRIATIFEAIKHGDEKHQAWLKQKIEEHFK